MDDNQMLTAAFAEVGSRYGYKDVKAEFAAFRDFKVKWIRSYRWASFEVSDYLKGAPVDVLGPLSETLYLKMRGECDTQYPQPVYDWLTSTGFRERNQPIYLERCRGTSLGTEGDVHDLGARFSRLVEVGLVDDDPELKLRWALNSRSNTAAKSSVLMKTVIVSDRLDSPQVPSEVLDYVLYGHIARIQMGYNPGNNMDSEEYSMLLERFPLQDEAEEGLRRLDMSL